MSQDKTELVECPAHGSSEQAFICGHLLKEGRLKALGFYQADIDPENRESGDLNAWCSDCDAELMKAGEWNDETEAFADIRFVCSRCFEEIKEAQIEFDPERVEAEPVDIPEDELFWDHVDDFIELANQKMQTSHLMDVGEALASAAARFNAFEAVVRATDVEKDRDLIITDFTERFRAQFIEHLDDYHNNRDEYLGKTDN